MEKNRIELLEWIYQRLAKRHWENENYDYMQAFKKEIELIKEESDGDGNFKRYLEFGCDRYYPAGDLNDVIDSFDTPEEAIACCKSNTYDYMIVWDRIADRIIEFD